MSHFACGPPHFRAFEGCNHLQGWGESVVVCQNMNEFSQNLRGQSEIVTVRSTLINQSSGVRVLWMISGFERYEKAGIKTMPHPASPQGDRHPGSAAAASVPG